MISQGLYGLLAQAAAVTGLLGKPPANSQDGPPIFFASAGKQPPTPFLVMHRLEGAPAGQTLDGMSDLIEGEFQFDSYANDLPTAQKISRAVRDALKAYSGALADGSSIQFTEVVADFDDGFELGDSGYLYRAVLRLKAMYTEGP